MANARLVQELNSKLHIENETETMPLIVIVYILKFSKANNGNEYVLMGDLCIHKLVIDIPVPNSTAVTTA